ncbi:hypothetical protein TNCV_3940211 [Trichonephila clavipes]|uniref:Uncharacterized protein n=1 Tax=Trichonephila clavipes TaxID=2585209 RepID=A0A8X7B8D0_TRICX|nr:hypothetical protein TNCV_3940211 [Trichonephila clavipes]
MSHQEKKRKHINSLQSLNDAIHWSSSTLNVPSGEKKTHQFSPILERCHPLEFFNSKCPIRRKKTETHQFSPILERCHPLEFFNSKCPIRRKKRKHINSLQSLNDVIHWSPSTLNVPSGEKKTETHQFSPILERCHPLEFFNSKCPIRRKTETHQFSQSLNDAIHWSPSTLNVPSGEKQKHINSLQSLNDVIHWSPSTLNVPSGEKTETHQFSPILERCHPLESFNSKCPIRRKKRKHINSLQSLNDAIHWSPSTLNVPSGEKTETHQFSPILERCHPLEFFNSKCPIRRKNENTLILSNP